jgi:hypothetical protein
MLSKKGFVRVHSQFRYADRAHLRQERFDVGQAEVEEHIQLGSPRRCELPHQLSGGRVDHHVPGAVR